MTFNRFDYIGLDEIDAHSLAYSNGFRSIVIKRYMDDIVYEGPSVLQVFNENRITLLSDDKQNVTDCYIG